MAAKGAAGADGDMNEERTWMGRAGQGVVSPPSGFSFGENGRSCSELGAPGIQTFDGVAASSPDWPSAVNVAIMSRKACCFSKLSIQTPHV